MADNEITLGVIMQHMQGMELRLTRRIDDVDHRLSGLNGRVDNLDKKLDRIYHNLSFQIDAIDKRLDEIEIEQLPKRVTAIERHLGLAV